MVQFADASDVVQISFRVRNLESAKYGIWNLESGISTSQNMESKSGIWNQYISKYGIKKVESGISTSQNMESGIWNLESVHRKIWNLESEIWNLFDQYIAKYGIWNLESGISTSQNMESGIWNLESVHQNVESGTPYLEPRVPRQFTFETSNVLGNLLALVFEFL